MRRFALLSLVLSAGALPLAAQFEGTIVMKMDANGKPETMTWYVRHDQLAMSMAMSQADPHATGEFRMVIDQAHHTSTMLIPMTPEMAKGMGAMAGNAKGMKMVTTTDSMQFSEDKDAQITKLGTSETIAGVSCDDYLIVGKDKKDATKACITDKMGGFVFPTTGMGRGNSAPSWSRAFGGRAAFPLKVVDNDGKVQMEAVSVTRGPVPASEFVIPDDYVDMSAMMRGMRGGH